MDGHLSVLPHPAIARTTDGIKYRISQDTPYGRIFMAHHTSAARIITLRIYVSSVSVKILAKEGTSMDDKKPK